jgi:uncharacterized membrane protein YozB (DUF420 family)
MQLEDGPVLKLALAVLAKMVVLEGLVAIRAMALQEHNPPVVAAQVVALVFHLELVVLAKFK